MGNEKLDKTMSFIELCLRTPLTHNSSAKVVSLKNIEALLGEFYTALTCAESPDAYPPLMLLKCLLLQKWYHIPSDPKLAKEINGPISFEKFVGLLLEKYVPSYSTLFHFRKRLYKKAMIKLKSEVLRAFSKEGLNSNEGLAVHARFVKSASRPMSSDDLQGMKEKRDTCIGNSDTGGNLLTFSRDLKSDWIIKNDIPRYGLKEYPAIYLENSFVLATTPTPALEHNSLYLRYFNIASCHTKDPFETVYGDNGYYGQLNRAFLRINGIADGIMCRDATKARLTKKETRQNTKISKKRYIVEQYVGMSQIHSGEHRARFTTILRNTLDAMARYMVFNISKNIKLLGVT
jgi:transposase, IS5 family